MLTSVYQEFAMKKLIHVSEEGKETPVQVTLIAITDLLVDHPQNGHMLHNV